MSGLAAYSTESTRMPQSRYSLLSKARKDRLVANRETRSRRSWTTQQLGCEGFRPPSRQALTRQP